VAPAGFGKTTLLADWRAAQQQGAWPLAWLALDAGDNDLARFLRYVIAALQTLRADLGLALRARRLPRRRRPAHPPGNGLPARPPPATGACGHRRAGRPAPAAGPPARPQPVDRAARRRPALHRRGKIG